MPSSPVQNLESSGFYRRDPRTVNWLPFEIFWEVTRRHTYYLACWKQARDDSAATLEERTRARQLLLFINVSLEPVDPGIAVADIGKRELASGFQRGAVLPMTFRSILGLLLIAPPEVRAAARDLLLKTQSIDTSTHQGTCKLHSVLNEGQSTNLDVLVPGMHFTLNPTASQRAMVDGMTNASKANKSKMKIPEKRRRLPEIAAYLHVWDQREGWANVTYDLSRERTLKEIASAEGTAASTVASRYKSGFEIITGHPYSPETWFRIFGVIKVQQIILAGNASVHPGSIERSERSDTSAEDAPSPMPHYRSATSLWELVKKIQGQLSRTPSDQEIAQDFSLDDTRLVTLLRSRLVDGLL